MSSTDPPTLGTIEEERRRRLGFLDRPDQSPKHQFERTLEGYGTAEERERIRRAWGYAESLDYDHPGQSAEVYLAHPLRVASLYLALAPRPTVDGVVTCLVHNVFEVTDLDVDELAAAVGRPSAEAVHLLTVDRERQWEREYKRVYYRRIAEAGPPAAPVKVIDKLDNLFVLHLNPSAEIRHRYLDEIEEHLIPLAEQAVPGIVEYLGALVADNRAYDDDGGADRG